MLRKLRATIGWAGYTALPGAIILRYHRVVDLSTDPNAVAVTPAHFRQQMEVLRHRFSPISLDCLSLKSNRALLPRRGVIVTFDDGYADNLHHAMPILERLDIPATVFVTTGYVGGTREFWWDTLETLLLSPGRLPASLRLSHDGIKLQAELGPDAEYTQADFARYRTWNWRSSVDPTRRHQVFRYLSDQLRSLDNDQREGILAELKTWAGEPESVRRDFGPLAVDELVRLASSDLIRIGAHSVSHPLLSALPPDLQWEEINGSRSFLENILETPVTCFAYPYGVSGGSEHLVERAGFELACTTRPGIVFRRHRRYRMPRLYVGNWGADEFERRLRSLP